MHETQETGIISRLVTIVSFTRIHTACLTMSVLIIAALLSGQSTWHVFLFAVFALFFHMFGFALNNLTDYRYDLKDPYKQHFPLISGRINYRHAVYADIAGILLAYVLGAWIVALEPIPMAMMSVAFLAGILYNLKNKTSAFGPVLISTSFALLIPYVMFSGSINITLMVLYFVFAFLTMYAQISVAGFIKDIEVDQYNMMSGMGMHLLASQIIFSRANRIYAWGLRTGVLVSGLLIWFTIPVNPVSMVLFVLLQLITLVLGNGMVRNNAWLRPWFLKRMSMVEVVNYLSLVFLFAPVYGVYWAIFLFVYPILWFMGMNYLFFGQATSPKV